MQPEPANDGRPRSHDDADLMQMFRLSTPSFASVDIDSVLKDASRSPSSFREPVSLRDQPAQREPGRAICAEPADSSIRRRTIMLTRLGVLGACAASVCLALTFGLWGGNTVLAQVQNALKKVRSATYTVTQSVGDQPAVTWKVKLLGENLCRVEQPNGIYLVFDIQAKKMMEVNPGESKVRITENLPVPKGFNILEKLANLNAAAAKGRPAVPDREIGGKSAAGFAIEETGVEYNVWVDSDTNLPLEMERVGIPASKTPAPEKATERWSDFRFDEPLDEALFAFDVPNGFAVDTRQAPGGDAGAPQDTAERARKQKEKAIEAARKAGSGSYGFPND